MSDEALFPYRRYVVRYWTEAPEKGRVRRDETLAGKPPALGEMLGHPVITYRRQENGDLVVISAELVKDIAVEQCDRYGAWHQTATLEVER